jgi:hypothetical protein
MGIRRVNEEATKKLHDALEAERDQLSIGIANALATWSEVEMMLAFVFVSVLDRSRTPMQTGLIHWDDESLQRRMSHTIMNAIIGFDTRVDVVTKVIAESDLRNNLKRLWPGVAQRLKTTYKRRHKAAHFIFDQVAKRDGSIRIYVAPLPATVTSMEDTRFNRPKIDELTADFEQFGLALRWFMHCVEIQRRRLKGPRAPAPALIQRVLQALKTPTQ